MSPDGQTSEVELAPPPEGVEPVLALRRISRAFGDFYANRNINLELYPGEVHCLVGENGAGKSTMMNMMYGLLPPTEGDIILRGSPVDFTSPRDAINAGIGMVHQHFMLIPVFTVAENIVLGDEPVDGQQIDLSTAINEVEQLSESYGLQVDPRVRVSDISVGQQQRVEILKALYRKADILILDEPTAVLTPQETDELLTIVRQLRDEGAAIIMITHKLGEVLSIADRISVLRRGEIVGSVLNEGQTEDSLAEMMVGREVQLVVDKEPAVPQEPVLSVRNLWVKDEREIDAVTDVSFDVHAGEIVALAGIDGNGQSELIEAIAGMREPDQGTVMMNGQDAAGLTPKQVGNLGFGHIAEDRHKHGLVLEFSIADNMILHDLDKPPISEHGVIDFDEVHSRAERLSEEFDIRSATGIHDIAGTLSGGNQQKIVIAREIERNPKFLVAAQPTRGVDIGAIEFIHERLVQERDRGAGILLVSLELQEVLGLADRILVIFEGAIVMEVLPQDANEQMLGLAMTGSVVEPGGAAQ